MKKRKNADVNYNLISVEESPVTTSKEQPLELKYDDSQTVKIKTIKPDSQKKKLVKKVIPVIYRNASQLGLDPIAGAVEILDGVVGETGAMLVVGEVKEKIENHFDVDIDGNQQKKARKAEKKKNRKQK